MNLKNDTRKICIRTISDFENLDYNNLMYPVIRYGEEKLENNMYDDWDEYKHTTKLINEIYQRLKEKQDLKIDIYFLKEDDLVIGICFFIYGKSYMENLLEKIENKPFKTIDNSVQLTCFHILKEYRGIGTIWLKDIIFPDLIKNNMRTVYVKSSHNKALSFYKKMGDQIGQYIGISDNELYQRLGYIYRININN